jgi:uncharacterized protein
MNASLPIELGGSRWSLLAGHAAFWHARRWLVVADVHFGKAATFRALGIPVPQGTTSATLARLTTLVEQTRPSAIVFLGDLFHAREAHAAGTLAAVRSWREHHRALELILVEGNHDLRAGAPPAELGITVVAEPLRVDAVAFAHHPQFYTDATTVAGHMHPAVRVAGRADDGVRLPCFWLREGLVILPAFGAFTGGARIEREPGDRVVAVAEGRLFEIPALRDAA